MRQLLCLLFISILFSQNPELNVRVDNENKSLGLRDLKSDIKVVAGVAETTFDMTFENTYDRMLEGQLEFPLSNGQTITRFAMELNGKLREAVAVEKTKGRQTFESIERRRIDPALLEKTAGNNFKLRVFPIPANGTKRLVLAYEHELKTNKSSLSYQLPLNFQNKIKQFFIRIEAFKYKKKPSIQKNTLENFAFNAWKESFIAEKKIENYLANSVISFQIPIKEDLNNVYLDNRKHPYFYSRIKIKPIKTQKMNPHSIDVFWDISSSAKHRDLEKERKFIINYIKKLNIQKIKFIPFNYKSYQAKNFNNSNIQKLDKYIQSLNYDGGTQLGTLDLTSSESNEILLISDALSNIGESRVKTTNNIPIYTITSSIKADFSKLISIANNSSGNFINLSELTIEKALQKLSEQTYFFKYAKYKKSDISEVYPSIPTAVHNEFIISGQLLAKNAKIELFFGANHKIDHKEEIIITKENTRLESDLIMHLWAQKKISELELDHKKNKNEIIAFAKKMGIVSNYTSLLVLDRIEDYAEYEIEPPEELKDKYFEILSNKQKAKVLSSKTKLDNIYNSFKNKQNWLNQDFQAKIIEPIKKPCYQKSYK